MEACANSFVVFSLRIKNSKGGRQLEEKGEGGETAERRKTEKTGKVGSTSEKKK